MRDIKYRIWNKKFKTFSYWGFNTIDGVPGVAWPATGAGISISECKRLSEQYTGLKDINGVDDLYQHDILKSFHFEDSMRKKHYLYHVIEWSNKYSCWMAVNKVNFKNGIFESGNGNIQLFVLMRQDHYIGKSGNIHDPLNSKQEQ